MGQGNDGSAGPAAESHLLEELDDLLARVVAEHLESDVPLGAFLSGGIDSSLVVAYAARASARPLRTFTIGVDESTQSEAPWARRVAERPFLLGEAFSAADLMVASVLGWAKMAGALEGGPALMEYSRRCTSREASKRARAD